MTKYVSRRELLASVGMAGAAIGSSTVGHSTAGALFHDTEQFAGNVLTSGSLDFGVRFDGYYESSTGSTSTGSGTADGDVIGELGIKDISPGDSGWFKFTPAVTGNPGYLWFCGGVEKSAENGRPDPEGESLGGDVWPSDGPGGEIGSALQATLRYLDPNSDTEVDLLAGSFTEVLEVLQYGIALSADPDYAATGYRVLDRPGSQVCFTDTGTPRLELDWWMPEKTGNTISTDVLEFELRFHAQQCRHNDGKLNPCAVQKGISLVAFCAVGATEPTAEISAITERDEDGVPVEIEWSSSNSVDTIVLYYGDIFENFEVGDETSGTIAVGDGNVRFPKNSGVFDQSPLEPCPEGETGSKYEYNENTNEFEVPAE
ncbi:MAG: hypothetical protein V5A56_15185 [Halolamina sp.]